MKIATLSLLSLVFAQVAALAGVDLGSPSSRTPYDAYMHPVKQVLGSLSREEPSMERVQNLMREGRSFRYSFTEPYVAATPSVTATQRAGDCKAKALWLCDQMGDQKVRFVVGKMHSSSKLSHAWVMWEHEGHYWILDCTNNSRPIAAETVSSSDYIAQYSWSKSGVYRHTAGNGTTAGVAGRRNSPVAADASR